MALSGTVIRNVGSYWRLRLVWTASQSISTNKSTITTKLYWEAVRSGVGAVYSSTSKSGTIAVGSDSTSFTATMALSAGGSKLLKSDSFVVTHEDDGRKTTTVSGSFNMSGVSLSGTDYGNESLSDSITLNTIPRASNLSSTGSFVAGVNKTLSISRHSTSFHHKIEIFVKNTSNVWVSIKRIDVPASTIYVSTSFSESETTKVFTTLAQRSSADSKIVLETYSGSNPIGGDTYEEGTVTIHGRSTTSHPSSFNIGDSIEGTISQGLSAYTHTIQLVFNNVVYPLHSETTVTNWAYSTSAIATALYGIDKKSKYFDGKIRIYTQYNGVQVQSYAEASIRANITNSDPTFTSSQISYDDYNSTTFALTADNQLIIQGQSILRARIISVATPKSGADISSYVITAGSRSDSATTSGYKTLGTIDAASGVNLVVKAVDTRGFSTTVTKPITVIPYAPPVVKATAARINEFEENTKLTLSGTVSAIKVGTLNKNTIGTATYEIKERTLTTYGTSKNFVVAQTIPTYTATNVTEVLDNLKAWDIKVTLKDKLSTVIVNLTVQVGQPILFIDTDKKSIGFNDFPQNSNEFRVNGRMVFGANMWAGNTGGENNTAGAIALNNSDIVGVNGLYFNDVSDNAGEGLLFLKTGKVNGSPLSTDYDNMYLRDGSLRVNDHPFMEFQAGSTTGAGLQLGGGGRTIIGAGESPYTIRDNTTFTTQQEYMMVGSDENIYFYTNLNSGWATKAEFRFDQNGYFYRPKYKENNGYNMVTARAGTAHDDLMLIQDYQGAIAVSGMSYVDITFPTAFSSSPEWVIVSGRESSSSSYHFAVYNATATGCRIYGSHIHNVATTYTTYFTVVACGRRV